MKTQFLVARGASNNQPPTDSAPNQGAAIAPSRPRRAMLSLRAVTMALLILSSLTRNAAGVIPLGGTVTTSGDQIYNDAVVLISDTTVMSTGGGNIVFNATVDGPYRLTIITSGASILNGPVGNSQPLAALTTATAGGTVLNGGTVTTFDAQTYNDAVVLGGNLTMASLGGGIISFNSTVDGMQALTVAAAGLSVFNGPVGQATPLMSLTTDTGTTLLNGGTVTTLGAQTYNRAVVLGANLNMASMGGGIIIFNSTIDGMQALTVATAGVSVFNGAVGGATALMSLTTDTGSTVVNGGTLTTVGSQTYNRAVVLAGNLTVASMGAGGITFNSTVDGAQSLTVATAGVSVFNGAVGGTTALTSLATDIGGATFLNGGMVTTTGAQIYDDAVTLLSNTTLTASQATIAVSLTTSSVSTIAAALINTGRIVVNGGTLKFLGTVTNSGMIQAGGGGVLNFVGSVFNTGVIDALAGKVTFSGGLSNKGTVVDATSFRLTTIRRVGNDIRLTWSTMAGHRYVVQATAPSAGGGYTKTFSDLGPILSAPGNAQSTLSYNHVGGATGSRSRFYRVRLVE